jgi:anti-anti-sigma factor
MIVDCVDSGSGLTRLRVVGEIDMATVAQLDAAMTDAIVTTGTVSVIVDMAGVTFCDSSGIAAFDRNYLLASQRGVFFQLIHVGHDVSLVLQVTGLLETLTGRSPASG